jgi:hypothetical protein
MWRTGAGFSAGSAAETSLNQGSDRVCGRGGGDELERVGDEIFASGKEDEVA